MSKRWNRAQKYAWFDSLIPTRMLHGVKSMWGRWGDHWKPQH